MPAQRREQLLTAAEVGKILGVPAPWVEQRAREGSLTSVRITGRTRRFRRNDVDRYMQQRVREQLRVEQAAAIAVRTLVCVRGDLEWLIEYLSTQDASPRLAAAIGRARSAKALVDDAQAAAAAAALAG
jgi:excisionase family DNA binding protein